MAFYDEPLSVPLFMLNGECLFGCCHFTGRTFRSYPKCFEELYILLCACNPVEQNAVVPMLFTWTRKCIAFMPNVTICLMCFKRSLKA